MLDQLQYQRDVIALESISGAAALENAINRLPQFLSTVKTTFVNLLASPLETLFSRREKLRVSSKLRTKPYLTLRDLEVQVPAGLATDYLTYAKVLLEAAHSAALLKNNVLQPFASWLGARLGDPSLLASLSANLEVKGFKLNPTDALHKKIFACLRTSGRQEVTAPYGQALRRNADWEELVKIMEEINGLLNNAYHREVVELTHHCIKMTDTLMQRMKEAPEQYRMSPEAVQALATTCYSVGRELEFYGLLRHRVGELSHALTETIKKIDRLPD